MRQATSFKEQLDAFKADRYGATHFLKPVLEGSETAFFTNGDDEKLQRAWARENGLKADVGLDDILLSQIESHRTEIFYNLDPVRYPSEFLTRLPGSVKHKLCWRAAPSGNADFTGYEPILCNFPFLSKVFEAKGWRTAHFTPSYDPRMEGFAVNADRPIDVLFTGSYSQYHASRFSVLNAIAATGGRHMVAMHLLRSRLVRLADTPLGLLGPLRRYRTPADVLRRALPPVFGLDYYEALSKAKIVLNVGTEIAGMDRGNMRCWEALGCGALMLTDVGNYPAGMADGQTMVTYDSPEAAVRLAENLLANEDLRQEIAARGHQMIRTKYSKEAQWQAFQNLL